MAVRVARWTLTGGLLSLLVGMFIGLGVHTFNYAEGTSYLSNDPEACINCHIMREQFDSWMKSPHHAYATCNDCHVPPGFIRKHLTKIRHGWAHSRAFTMQDFHEPIRITPSSLADVEENCYRCHAAKVEFMGARHVGAQREPESSQCVHCHAGIGHGPRR